MTTYTAIDRNSGEMIETGLTVAEAAHIILTDDSREYEVRRSELGDSFALWSRQQVANRGWTQTRFYSLAGTADAAWAEIAQKVVDTHNPYAPGSYGPEIVTDDQYAEMLAQRAEEEE